MDHMCVACEKQFSNKEQVQIHMKTCIETICQQGGGGDIRNNNDPDHKKSFMKLFGMRPVGEVEVPAHTYNTQDTIPNGNRPRRAKSNQALNYFRHNPVPISSNRGKRFLQQTKAGLVQNPGELARKVDKACAEPPKSKLRVCRRQFPTTVSKRSKFKPYQYIHEYSFGRRARIHRNTELVVGVKTRSYKILNECKGFQIRVKALTNEEIARATVRRGISIQGINSRAQFLLSQCKALEVPIKALTKEEIARACIRRVLPLRHPIVPRHFTIQLEDILGTHNGKKFPEAALGNSKLPECGTMQTRSRTSCQSPIL